MIDRCAGTAVLLEKFTEISLHHTPRVSVWKKIEFATSYISCKFCEQS